MDSYSLLLKQVLNNEVLKQEIKDLISEQPEALNLISHDWEQRLSNDILYQQFCQNNGSLFRSQTNPSKYYNYEFIKDKSFNILVAAECRFPKKYADKTCSVILDAEPLRKIAKAMYSDMEPDINLCHEFKFNFNMCSASGCYVCEECFGTFIKKGYKVDKLEQPCISDTRIYDGKNIVNRFYDHIQNMFADKFLALLCIKVETRYNYVMDDIKCYRIGGKIQSMTAFQESKLYVPRSVNVGRLIDVDSNLLMEETKSSKDSEIDSVFKLPEVTSEKRYFEQDLPEGDIIEAVPLNKRQHIDEKFEVEEKVEFVI